MLWHRHTVHTSETNLWKDIEHKHTAVDNSHAEDVCLKDRTTFCRMKHGLI